MQCTLRTHEPGDIGWIIAQHGLIYTQEFGFDPSFEIHIAKKFVDLFGPYCDKFNTIWLAEVNQKKSVPLEFGKKPMPRHLLTL